MKLEEQFPYEVNAIFVAGLTALRIGEVLSLKWEHVNLELSQVVLPVTKGGRRSLPLAGPIHAILSKLARIPDNDYVFPASRGFGPVPYRQARLVFAMACEQAGLENVRLHDLRRSMLTQLAGAGASAFQIRDQAGHKSLAMANRYVQAGQAMQETAELGATIMDNMMKGKHVTNR